jgi:hypothetical protein
MTSLGIWYFDVCRILGEKCLFETSVTIHKTTYPHNQEDHVANFDPHDNPDFKRNYRSSS